MLNSDLFYFFNHNFQNPIFNSAMPVITHFGGFISLIIIVLAIIVYAKLKKKENLKRVAILALIALLFSDSIALFLKNFVHEPRPFVSLDNVNLLISESDPNSFPSGHTTSTLAVVTIFVLNMKKLVGKHYILINVCLIVFAAIIPFSRMYVGVHYPSDVLAGIIIGISSALIIDHFSDEILSFLSF